MDRGAPSTSSQPRLSARTVVPLATCCFFLSGVSALLYEVVWTRLLGLAFGHTVFAITTVLAAYMGGLALGSLLLGRWADRVGRPLRAYALLEAAIGAYCLATPLLFPWASEVHQWAQETLRPSALGSGVLQFFLSAGLMLPPTVLMGATLPLLSRALIQRVQAATSRVATLYSVNTWGAVVGTAATGFVLLPVFGLRHTVWLGAGLNAGIAVLAFMLERLSGPLASRSAAPRAIAPRAGESAGLTRVQVLVGMAAIAVSGATSMAYEVVWTRALSLALGSSTYAFTAMLCTFLVGLALGAFLVSRILARRRVGLAAFGVLQLAIALAAVSVLPLLGRLPEAVLFVLGHVGVTAVGALGAQFCLGFLVMIVPTLLIGATFPLLVAALSEGLERLGSDVGRVYGVNTLGTIAGTMAAGFILLPTIGMQNTVLFAASVNLTAGLAVLSVSGRAARRSRIVGAGLCAAFLVFLALMPRWDPKLMTSGAAVYAKMFLAGEADALGQFARGRELLFYKEGLSTTVAVVRDPDGTVLTVNGKGDASNDIDMVTQLLLGHIGPLLEPGARRALVIGLASGVTVGAVAQHPLKSIDVAEIEPAMEEASKFFSTENRRALSDPRVRVIQGDGRSILALAPEPYDLIVSEPSNPWIAGVANLFTREFYRAARQKLSPQGVMVQWLQGYSIFTRDMQMVVATFREAFPHVSVWAASPNDYLLVATPDSVKLDFELIRRRLSESPGLREDFDRFGLNGEGLVFCFFLGEDDARRYAEGAEINTDDLPLLEFSAPRAVYAASATSNEETLRSFRVRERPEVTGLDPELFTGDGGHVRAARSNWLAGRLDQAHAELSRLSAGKAVAPATRLEHGRLLFALGDFAGASAVLTGLIEALPGDEVLARYLRALTSLRAPSVARELAKGMESLETGGARTTVLGELFLELARQHRSDDFYLLALEQIEAEVQMRPGSYQTLNNYAGVLLEVGRVDEAARALGRAVLLKPDLASTHFNLGLTLERQGALIKAIQEHETAARLEPGWAKPQERLRTLRKPTVPP